MAIRYETVANVDEMLEFWKAGLLRLNINSADRPRSEWQMEVVSPGWDEWNLRKEYNSEISWKKDEWAVAVED